MGVTDVAFDESLKARKRTHFSQLEGKVGKVKGTYFVDIVSQQTLHLL
jgi:hypothetical protein